MSKLFNLSWAATVLLLVIGLIMSVSFFTYGFTVARGAELVSALTIWCGVVVICMVSVSLARKRK